MTTPKDRPPALMIQSAALSAVMTLALLLSWAALPTRAGAEAKPGDIITTTIEGIGTMTNACVERGLEQRINSLYLGRGAP